VISQRLLNDMWLLLIAQALDRRDLPAVARQNGTKTLFSKQNVERVIVAKRRKTLQLTEFMER
jgi:hypothetical protein